MKNMAFLFTALLVLASVLAACAPRTQDSGMAGSVTTEPMTDMQSDMQTGAVTGGEMDMMDMSGGMMSGGMMSGGDMSMDMSDMDMDGAMTGGDMNMDMSDMESDMTGGADMSTDMSDMDTMTGGADSSESQAGAGDDTQAPTGTLEVAASPAGPFYNDRPDGISEVGDSRIVGALPGSSFFLRVNYSDPSGITGLAISLRNSEFEGTLPSGPFTVDESASTSTCDEQLATAPTELNCTLKVDVAADAQNISESGEFAYVFRAQVTDAAGNTELGNERGYVVVR